MSPKARYQVPAIVRLWVEFDIFAAATIALFFSDKEFLAVLFAVSAIVSRTLKTVWKQ